MRGGRFSANSGETRARKFFPLGKVSHLDRVHNQEEQSRDGATQIRNHAMWMGTFCPHGLVAH